MRDKQTTFCLKINAAGSWANAGTFSVDVYERVKSACIPLVFLSVGSLKFKTVDDAGSDLEMLSNKHDWMKLGEQHG